MPERAPSRPGTVPSPFPQMGPLWGGSCCVAQVGGQLAFFSATGQLEEDVLERASLALGLVTELVQRTRGDDVTVVDDAHPVTQVLGDFEHVRREKHGVTALD